MSPLRLVTRYFILGCIAIVLFFALEFYFFTFKPLNKQHLPYKLEVMPGSNISQIAQQLENQDILERRHFFILIARMTDQSHFLKAGEYMISPGTTPQQLLGKLVTGEVQLRKFTLIEGWNKYQLFKELHQSPYLKHDLIGLSDQQILDKLNIKEKDCEGLFLPDTYSFAKNTTESTLLSDAYHLMQEKLQLAWMGRDPEVSYSTPYESLIVASMIEKETASAPERNKIAGVILRRLKNNMLLQIDPTVIYGVYPTYLGQLTKDDLQSKNPYNTYINRGLPPTPIAMPSEASIQAAMHPDKSNNLYFVSNGDGTHIFTDNLASHNLAVGKLRSKTPAEKK